MNSLSASPDREIKPLAGNKGLILAIRVLRLHLLYGF